MVLCFKNFNDMSCMCYLTNHDFILRVRAGKMLGPSGKTTSESVINVDVVLGYRSGCVWICCI